ncbi:D-alanyl-D-alanine carboxypeptidase family protein [Fredinandcohnia sp. 179-A 10B2 NHS]|uniref:D-alanyl-D-alanine carboxypeptidase family protein n=1 Tax=Fredinandcohnia sp. 179-A 10B2 NHS TaxID=3235176 RepID=UPI00399FBAB3
MKQLYVTVALVFLFAFYPIVAFANEDKQVSDPTIQSESAILLDANTGSILYEKNSKETMYPASLTKMATAIYAIEKGKLDDIVTVSENAWETGGTRVYLEPGEQVPLEKLVQGLLINSGNDAGVAIAEHLHGDVESFSNALNVYLKEEIGLQDTNFVNPHGLFDENHYTTAHDLAVLTQYALRNKEFTEIFGMKELPWVGTGWETTIYNHHRLLLGEIPYEGIIGGKNGFVQQSRFTLSTAAEQGELKLVAIVLMAHTSDISYDDTVELLDYGFENFEVSEVSGDQSFSTSKGRESYQLKAPLSYTHKKDEVVNIELDELGVLKVQGDDGRILASKQLEQNMPREVVSTRAELKDTEVRKSGISYTYIFLALSFIFVGIAIYLRNRVNTYPE